MLTFASFNERASRAVNSAATATAGVAKAEQMVAQLEGVKGEVSNVKADDPSKTSGAYHVEFDVSLPNFLD